MSTSNVLGGALGLFSGRKCEGTWTISDHILRISFDTVPDSWLNQDLRIGGFGFRLPLGDILTKIQSISLSLTQFSKCRIVKLDANDLAVNFYRGVLGQESSPDMRWSRHAAQ
jgi:hypothetical protein